jgi:SAM-dependent methyltransferase
MSWTLDPKQWLAPPDSNPAMPHGVDALDKQALAAMSEPLGLDEHALLRAEAAADHQASQVHMQTEHVGVSSPPAAEDSVPAADAAGSEIPNAGVPTPVPEEARAEGSHADTAEAPAQQAGEPLEVRLEAPSAQAGAFRPRSKAHVTEQAGGHPVPAPVASEGPAPEELDVSLTPAMPHAVDVTPETPPDSPEQSEDSQPVGLFIPSLTAEPEPEPEPEPTPEPVSEPEPEPEYISGASLSGEFIVPSVVREEVEESTQRKRIQTLNPDEFEEELEEAEEDEAEAPAQHDAELADVAEEEIEAEEVLEVEEVPQPPPPGPPPSESRRRRHWGESVFQEHYLATLPEDWKEQAVADVHFLDSVLDLEEGASVVDIGCGNGRHVFAFKDLGYEATGVDNSLAMLLAAGQRNEGRAEPANFLHADMRELPTDAKYDAVVCLGSSYGYFEDEVNKQVLCTLRDLLRPGGKLVIQVFNRDYVASRLPCRSWWASSRGMIVDEAEMNYFANRLRVHRTIVIDDGRNFEHYMFMKAFTLHDLGKSMSSVGLKVLEVSGSRDTRGRFYGSESPDIWIVAERRSAES